MKIWLDHEGKSVLRVRNTFFIFFNLTIPSGNPFTLTFQWLKYLSDRLYPLGTPGH